MPRNDLDHDLRPGEVEKLIGAGSMFDWERHREANVRCEIIRRDDGSASIEFLRYAKLTRSMSDRRRVPIDGETFLALVDALFAPVESNARIDAVRKTALDSGRYGTCPKCKGDGWDRCRLCHGKGITATERIAAWERDEVASDVGCIEVPWNPSVAEAEEVELPPLWLDIRAVIDGDGDAPALANLAAIPNATGPVKLAVVPMDGAGVEVQTLTMSRVTYLALAAALASCQEIEP